MSSPPIHRRRIVLPEDYAPPRGIRTFYLCLIQGARRRQSSIDHLTDEELAWVERVVIAERERREI